MTGGGVSVITISFNQKKYLQECIESVLSSNSVDQYLVVDPGSTDGSRELITHFQSLDSRVRPVFLPDRGPAEGLNNGLSQVTGKYWYFINADDKIVADGLDRAFSFMEENPDITVLMGKGLRNQRGVLSIYDIRPISPLGYGLGLSFLFQQSVVIRTSASQNLWFNVENRSCWDGEFFVDLMLNDNKVVGADWIIGEFRVHDDSITGSGRLEKIYARDNARLRLKCFGYYRRGSQFKQLFPDSVMMVSFLFQVLVRRVLKR